MRLTVTQREFICRTVSATVGTEARVVLFGSRLNDDARGGDLNLLIESDSFVTRLQRSRIKLALEAVLVMPVDIVVIKRGEPATAFQRIALATGVSLGGQ